MARNYLQGKYTLTNPHKYIGDKNNIIYRSSYELKAFKYLDTSPSILKWNSEENIIEYFNPIDRKGHRYFVDLSIEYKNKAGEIKRAIVEIKPKVQTTPPKLPPTGRQTRRYIQEQVTFMTNSAKWAAAEAWAKKNGWDFFIWTERELGIV